MLMGTIEKKQAGKRHREFGGRININLLKEVLAENGRLVQGLKKVRE